MSVSELEHVFISLTSILEHIENTNTDIANMMDSSMNIISTELQDCKKDSFSVELSEALQLQDIISQQHQAVTDAIRDMQKNIAIYLHSVRTDHSILEQSMKKLYDKMDLALEEAKKKHSAFSGQVNSTDAGENLEFF